MFEAIHEQRPVRQPSERIVERVIAELLYQGFAFGDVPGIDHHTPHSRVVKQVVYDMLKVAPRAVLVGHSELQGRVEPRSFQDLGERVQRLLPVVRMDRVECVGPYLLFRPVAGHPLDCRAYVVHGAVRVEDRDDIGAVLYQRAEALLAFFDCFLDLLAFAHVLYLADEVERLVLLVVHYRDAEERPHHVSVFVEVPLLRLVSADHSDQEPPEVLQIDLQIIGMGYLLEGLPQQLPFRVAEYLAQRLVHPQEAPVGSHQRHPCGRTFEGTPEALLTLSERTLGPLALGDVADYTREQSFTILVSFTKGHLDGELAAVFTQSHQLSRATYHARFARLQVTVQPGYAMFAVSFGHNHRDRLPDDLFRPVAKDAFRPTIEPPDYPIRRYGHDRVEGGVQNGAVACLALS